METEKEDTPETRERRTLLRLFIQSKFGDTKNQQARLIEYANQKTGAIINQGELSGLLQDNGKSFGEKRARSLALQLGIPPDYFTRKGGKTADELVKNALDFEVQDVRAAYSVHAARPKLNTVSAGGFKESVDHIHPDEAEWIQPREANGGQWSAWLVIENDSMEPDFKAGDLILVDPEQAANHGDFVVASNGDNHWTFKQLVRDGADWYLKPLNPQYKAKQVTEDVTILGRVIEHQPKARKL